MQNPELKLIELKNEIDGLIKSGQIRLAKSKIEELSLSKVPRVLKVDFADLARRVQAEYWGLRLLHQIIHPDTPIHPAVTDREITVYAGLLIRIGAFEESEKWLNQIKDQFSYQMLLFKSHLAIYQWDYRSAKKILNTILENCVIDKYQQAVCKLNLISSFIFLEEYKSALRHLNYLMHDCDQNNWTLLKSNAHELYAQIAIFQNKWDQAHHHLSLAYPNGKDKNKYSLFAEKWKLVCDLRQNCKNPEKLKELLTHGQSLKEMALNEKSWEVVRDIDFHISQVTGESQYLTKLYFGTPFLEYKKRIQGLLKKSGIKIPQVFVYEFSEKPSDRIFNLQIGREKNGPSLKPGQSLHRLFVALSRDLYKPVSLGELFNTLYPGEYFNPESSPERIYFAIRKLRHWLSSKKIPLKIVVVKKRFSLKPEGSYAFEYTLDRRQQNNFKNNFEVLVDQLKTHWPYQSFSKKKASEFLNISPSQTFSVINFALSQNKLFKSGSGRSVLYRFSK